MSVAVLVHTTSTHSSAQRAAARDMFARMAAAADARRWEREHAAHVAAAAELEAWLVATDGPDARYAHKLDSDMGRWRAADLDAHTLAWRVAAGSEWVGEWWLMDAA
jgi:hypothetical protein